jgi:hypothetical protein
MALCLFTVARIVPEDREYHSYGDFVIDTSRHGQAEILALLSDQDMRKIGVELGIIANPGCAMPVNMRYELNACFANPLDVSATPTFTSDNGHGIWIRREFKTHSLWALTGRNQKVLSSQNNCDLNSTIIGALIGLAGAIVRALMTGALTLFRDWRMTCAERRRLAPALAAEIETLYLLLEESRLLQDLQENNHFFGGMRKPFQKVTAAASVAMHYFAVEDYSGDLSTSPTPGYKPYRSADGERGWLASPRSSRCRAATGWNCLTVLRTVLRRVCFSNLTPSVVTLLSPAVMLASVLKIHENLNDNCNRYHSSVGSCGWQGSVATL